MKTKKLNQWRQGDVFIERIDHIPASAKAMPPEKKTILAYGEVTGHHHRIESPHVRRFEENGVTLLEIDQAVTLLHEEHDPITLEPGTYQATIQREYSPEAIRSVAD